jgi:hypothetical protein
VSRESLEALVAQVGQTYIPVTWQHDLRYPPLGRVVAARLVELPDGELAVEGDQELWEADDDARSAAGDGRGVPIRIDRGPGLTVGFDRTFENDEFLDQVRDLARLIGTSEPEFNVKKALEPISILVIAGGAFALGSIASGFFGKIGSDAYDGLKARLKALYRDRRSDEELLDFNLGVAGEEGAYEVHLLVVGPDDRQLDNVLDTRFAGLDELVAEIVKGEPDIAKVVTIWKDGGIDLAYAVRSDAYPVVVNWDNIPPLLSGDETDADGVGPDDIG